MTLVNTLKYIVMCVLVAILLVETGYAQSRGAQALSTGDLGQVMSGFRAIMSIATLIVPFLILAYTTWKYPPRSSGDAGWCALGWCALAYVIR